MSRRGRALIFAVLAAACAVIAATLASGYGKRFERQFGPLRPVVVATRDLPARQPIGPEAAERHLQVRRVPARFVPPGALASPRLALGQAPAAAVPAGAYLLGDQLAPPREKRGAEPELGRGRRPVEIAVSGGEALLSSQGQPGRSRVDVVVTSEPESGGPGRTSVVAEDVALLDLREGGLASGADEEVEPGAGGDFVATLALTRAEALQLIAAESFARQVRLLPHLRSDRTGERLGVRARDAGGG